MKTLCNLPQDIILEEIVLRLPLKSALRLRSMCKKWRSFIDSERFAKKHLQFSAKVSAILNSGHGVYHCPLQTTSLLLEKNKLALLADADHHMNQEMGDAKLGVVGCCNGVVCIFSSEGVCYLWNPSTRISKELPRACVDGKPPAHFSLPGFGWDESSNAYKVFAIESHRSESVRINNNLCKVYSSKTNSWRAVEERRNFDGVYGGGQFARGKLHWQRLGGGGFGEIVTLDVKSEEFGVMEPACGWVPWALGVVGNGLRQHEQQLCVLSCYNLDDNPFKGRLDFWVFKEEEEGWIKLISAAATIHDGYPIQFNAAHLVFMSNGVSDGLMVYDAQRNQVTFIPRVHLCLQTLVRF